MRWARGAIQAASLHAQRSDGGVHLGVVGVELFGLRKQAVGVTADGRVAGGDKGAGFGDEAVGGWGEALIVTMEGRGGLRVAGGGTGAVGA